MTKDVKKIVVSSGHVPGSQPPFLIPDPDQNKKDVLFISVVGYAVYRYAHFTFD